MTAKTNKLQETVKNPINIVNADNNLDNDGDDYDSDDYDKGDDGDGNGNILFEYKPRGKKNMDKEAKKVNYKKNIYQLKLLKTCILKKSSYYFDPILRNTKKLSKKRQETKERIKCQNL